ncbi:1-deoxy-D-xylulose-5-phosphate synthase [Cellulophaga lytica]|uniref:1-deoxy-D-xylulose-5-phosphate synthase n=1 Tax=Cellulophaga lytica (strain ATCC 23178 / DSM 7489 / JCM 8516 / NBRC 14961 / NCIMB 1423 / VKM B-1433 / Cy l20) TaxID=867900 RepID=F0RAR7_CELLC|nr:1-deoxy-D-xylulose-5-phosphate synthase [Cellulophaga lytica]ADY29473.1 1-deoxy-D-xylulose-5-phosphate synthase [Cellulophaga lytica DSM 7489]AIM60484.1 1-deoxy-D-xylulose-5-phosphate synthase [Cellulophaga lytica]APU10356.1 1-deoxy-D-xylulose-5-phosphate synthase [Cellulophaga lytica]WQG76353.1 1-deoxy-D-xylulose-5-phosphate synthase [Cellulophaga lytica]SNQ42633.1 1-Deoxy-D-xylulose-5-phosphate synthase [Cellulophaga lytica]
MAYLNNITTPDDLRKIPAQNLPIVAKELRDFIIDIVSAKEGHLGASLGVVELTVALHYVFNTPFDKLIWDVGHQAYGHKILTGRSDVFETNRQLNGISGFPKREESIYDDFGTGHSSTSISAILGMAIASKLKGETLKQHIAVIGDASIASGMAFEGLNHAGVTDANVLIILNDNAIGIDPSVGALKQYLTNVKKGSAKQDNIFEALNFNYSGPIDGHNLPLLIEELNRLKTVRGPKFLHVITTKGKGLKKAEENQVTYHAPGKFNKVTGDLLPKVNGEGTPKYQDVFGLTIVELAKENKKIVGITPAMPTGSSLKIMMEEIPDRAFDVGIAEQHAVTLAAGMVAEGLVPFCNIYSTFLQRAYDQVIHDVALQNLPVIFCLDRAGLVGEDGATHHGVYDIAYLRCIPNLLIFAPMNEEELRNIMYTAQLGLQQPIAIRYPRGRGVTKNWKQPFTKIEIGKSLELKKGTEIVVLSVGHIGNMVAAVLNDLDSSKIGHVNMRFIKPLDVTKLLSIFNKYSTIVTIEDGCKIGGFGSAILEFANTNSFTNKVHILGIDDVFVQHGSVAQLHEINNIGANSFKIFIESLHANE